MSDLADFMAEFKAASDAIAAADSRFDRRLDSFDRRQDSFEQSLNEVMKHQGRPTYGGDRDDGLERKSAREICAIRHAERVPKDDGVTKAYSPSSGELDEALAARRAWSHVIRHGSPAKLDAFEQKSLSAFSFAGTGMLAPPERMNEILSCLVYPSDISGLVGKVNISGPAAEFLIENPRMGLGGWACEATCFANNPAPDLSEGLGILTIKPETIRFIACATRDFVEDASMNAESWIMRRISEGMSARINNSILIGCGIGKPLGLFNPRAGIPICETSASTPAGSLSWQDVFALKYEISMQWMAGASFLCNQRTWAQICTMSDASGRPLWSQLPGGEPGFMLAGSPVHIVTQMPDISAGATPLAFGNWEKTYTIVWRKAVTLLVDPYSANFCYLYKAEARVGGGVTCPNAARLLRIR